MTVPLSAITDAMLVELFQRCEQQQRWSRQLRAISAELRICNDQLLSESHHGKARRRKAARSGARLTAAT